MEWRKAVINMVGVVDAIFVGSWNVGNVQERDMQPLNAGGNWTAYCYLPGVQTQLGHYDSEQKARAELERVVKEWIKQSGIAS